MCLVLTTWDWINYRGICSWRKQIFLLSVIMGETLFCPIRVHTTVMCGRSCWLLTVLLWRFRGCSNPVLSKDVLSQCSSWTFLLQSSISSSTVFSEPTVEGSCCWCAIWDRAPSGQSCPVFWLVLNLSSSLYLLQKEACLVSSENYICPRGKV